MTAVPARFAAHVGQTIRDLPAVDREELHEAIVRACEDPWSWPQADKYEMDEAVRVITTRAAIVHYVIIPGAEPHLWVFAITV
ncbi:hypothetical protein SAM9427_36745 (plasmid) [Streptomyces sp. ETH9427]|uniref:hypothetical protein n=1 Tax=Streptomyces sp. E1N211 TaxID=1851876 RepID=UPI000E0A1D4F|nr:hypothetical protein [Streptomyces sp. E1N211]AXI91320.1 hypothetical protein SAM9427_36745 [Streptomyces sp. ETH9427]